MARIRPIEEAVSGAMGRPYAREMAKLAETFAWATAADLQPLRQAVRTAGLSPLRAIGSGGSLTGAHALAGLHQRYTGHPTAVATPLEAAVEPLGASAGTWLLSAGGGNVDIVAAAKTLILREPRQLCVLCGRGASPLAELCRKHPYVDLLLYPPPAGKDGFLATNSLLGFIALLTRAYADVFGSDDDWRETVDCLDPLLPDTAAAPEAWKEATAPLWTRPTTLVLHGPSTRVGAVDLDRSSRRPRSVTFRSPTTATSPTVDITGSPSGARRAPCSPSSRTRTARSPSVRSICFPRTFPRHGLRSTAVRTPRCWLRCSRR